MAPASKNHTALAQKTSSKRSSAYAPTSSRASKQAKFNTIHDDDGDDGDDDGDGDDDVSLGVDAGNSVDYDSDIDDAFDEEGTVVVAPGADLSRETQTRAVLEGLQLESRYRDDLSFFDILLDNSTVSLRTRDALKTFRTECLSVSNRSTEATDVFLQRRVPSWACHNEEVTGLWDELVEKLVTLGVHRSDLVKPSGTWGAVLACLWHYPTFNTTHERYGMVADPTNCSLDAQNKKAGPSDRILTIDRHPMRHIYVRGGVSWKGAYAHWDTIDELTREFAVTLLSFSKVVVLIGEENVKNYESLIRKAPGDSIVRAFFTAANNATFPETMFSERTRFYYLKNEAGAIKQLIFTSYHSQYFMHSDNWVRACFTDLTWNAILEFCGLDIIGINSFVVMSRATPKPKSYYLCFFVDPITHQRCYAVRSCLKNLTKHWNAYHQDVSWDPTKVTLLAVPEVPVEEQVNKWTAPPRARVRTTVSKRDEATLQAIRDKAAREQLLLRATKRSDAEMAGIQDTQDHYAVEESRLLSLPKDAMAPVPVAKIGGRKTNNQATRPRCPFVDPVTGERCKKTLASLNGLRFQHFKKCHPDAVFVQGDVEYLTKAEQDELSAASTTLATAGTSLKTLHARARSTKCTTKQRALYNCQCLVPGCTYLSTWQMSNFKTHVLRHHPNVTYSSKLAKKVEKPIVADDDDDDDDKENLENIEEEAAE